MRGGPVALAFAFLTVSASFGVAAAGDVAPPLSVQNPKLYAHFDGQAFYMSTQDQDSNGDQNVGSGAGPGSVLLDYTWTIPLKPALASDVAIDPTGNIVVTAYLGGSQSAGQFDVTTQLLSGSNVVADGPSQSSNELPATVTGSYAAITWTLTPKQAVLAGGQDLTWTLHATGHTAGLFLGMSEARGRSNVVLPVTGDAPAAASSSATTSTATGNSTHSGSSSGGPSSSASTSKGPASTTSSAAPVAARSSTTQTAVPTSAMVASAAAKKSPAAAPLAVLAVLACAVVAMRRRLA